MGLCLSSVWEYLGDIKELFLGSTEELETLTVRSISFNGRERETTLRSVSFNSRDSDIRLRSLGSGKIVIEESMSFKNWETDKIKFETTISFKGQDQDECKSPSRQPTDDLAIKTNPTRSLLEMTSPRPISELDAAAVKLQKVYKSYRTRRNLADCAVVVEELWWKALDFAALKRSSVSFFDIKRPETAVSRWARARTRVAKVGKGLSKDEKAQKLALRHWLEAIDPRHRYGHNLHLYYDVWFDSESTQPFFYWLDVGDGREMNLELCPRNDLQRQCIKYLGPKEREEYEVIVDSGRLVYRKSSEFVNTVEGSKWIFVLSTSRALYVGQKKKGVFQHSSFLSGGATTAAGRLVAESGVLKAIWPYSGHYLPTEENFQEFLSFLEASNVDLADVKMCATDDDSPSFKVSDDSQAQVVEAPTTKVLDPNIIEVADSAKDTAKPDDDMDNDVAIVELPTFDLGNRLSCKWTTGAGPRIGCVRDYPTELQFRALEHVNLSPRTTPGSFGSCGPIPSPRPSPRVRLSPRLSGMCIASPRVSIQTPRISKLSPTHK